MTPRTTANGESLKPRRMKAPVRREEILAAAVQVFSERGYAASMGEVAEAAGTIRTALYYYFPGKKELFLAVAESMQTELLRYVAPAVTASDIKAQSRASVHALISFGQDHPGSWNILFPRGEEVDAEVLEMRESLREMAVSTLAALVGSQADLSGIDPHSRRVQVMGEMLLGGAVQVMSWWKDNPEASLEEVEDAVFDLIWLGVKGLDTQWNSQANALG